MTNQADEFNGVPASVTECQFVEEPVVNDEKLQPVLSGENPNNVSAPEETETVRMALSDLTRTQALLETAYQSRGHKLSLKKTDFKNLSVSQTLWSEDVKIIDKLTKTDKLLVFPHKILASIVEAKVVGSVRDHLVDLMREAVVRHPAFNSSVIREQLESDTMQPNIKEIEESLSQLTTSGVDTGDEKILKPIEARKVAINFLSYLALDRLLRSEWTIERYIDEMFAGVWSTKSLGHLATGAALSLAKDPESLGLVAANYSERMKRRERDLETAERMSLHQASRATQAELERDSGLVVIHQLETELAVSNEETVRLGGLLAQEHDARSADQLHHANDKELMRTRLLRQLKVQTELLSDGSHALSNGSLRTASEFIDRAIEAINHEIEQLKGMGGSGK